MPFPGTVDSGSFTPYDEKNDAGGFLMELNLKAMTTETRNPNTMNLDTMSVQEILTIMNREDEKVPLAIRQVLPKKPASAWKGPAAMSARRLDK